MNRPAGNVREAAAIRGGEEAPRFHIDLENVPFMPEHREAPMTPKITLTDAPTPEMWKAIGDALTAFNRSRIGEPYAPRPLVLLLSNPDSNEIVGGLHGSTGFSYLYVNLLFVPESMRGGGVGRKLMMEAEAEAIQRGCSAAWLDTFSFQARGFYEKLGYSVFGTLDDYPPGHSRFYLTKRLVGSGMPAVALRSAQAADLAFCRRVEHETMRWIIDDLFGWDEAQQVENFARAWRAEEVRIITVGTAAGRRDAGWLQTAPDDDAIFVKSIYLDQPFQRQGIGTRVMRIVIDEAQRQSKAVALVVFKINPARRLYGRLGFYVMEDDEYKFYLRRDAAPAR
jgi:GNAT superfamily N-acetyltransferase